MIDTHCHLDDKKYDDYIAEIVADFDKDGIDYVISNASKIELFSKTAAIISEYRKVFGAFGVHPHEAKEYTQEIENMIFRYSTHDKAVGFGEIGLDYFYNFSDRPTQRKVFARQLAVADELGLPIILHVRDAYEDAFRILQENKSKIRHGGELHCYSGSLEMAKRFRTEFDFYFAFGGPITYRNARKDDVIEFLPMNRILSETDSPYLTPVPYRGEINEPNLVKYPIERIAQVKELSVEEVNAAIKENTERLFPKIKVFFKYAG